MLATALAAVVASAAAPARAAEDAETLQALHKVYAGWEFGEPAFATMQVAECVRPISYDAPPTCLMPGYDRDDTIVGFALLKKFNSTFDYPDGKIYMRVRK